MPRSYLDAVHKQSCIDLRCTVQCIDKYFGGYIHSRVSRASDLTAAEKDSSLFLVTVRSKNLSHLMTLLTARHICTTTISLHMQLIAEVVSV